MLQSASFAGECMHAAAAEQTYLFTSFQRRAAFKTSQAIFDSFHVGARGCIFQHSSSRVLVAGIAAFAPRNSTEGRCRMLTRPLP